MAQRLLRAQAALPPRAQRRDAVAKPLCAEVARRHAPAPLGARAVERILAAALPHPPREAPVLVLWRLRVELGGPRAALGAVGGGGGPAARAVALQHLVVVAGGGRWLSGSKNRENRENCI